MRIGELARRTGVSERSLRYYEERGLLHPDRAASGYRSYGGEAVQQVSDLRILLSAGLSTATIAEILPCMGRDGDMLVPACKEIADILLEDQQRLRDHIESLQRALLTLTDIVDSASSLGAGTS